MNSRRSEDILSARFSSFLFFFFFFFFFFEKKKRYWSDEACSYLSIAFISVDLHFSKCDRLYSTNSVLTDLCLASHKRDTSKQCGSRPRMPRLIRV